MKHGHHGHHLLGKFRSIDSGHSQELGGGELLVVANKQIFVIHFRNKFHHTNVNILILSTIRSCVTKENSIFQFFTLIWINQLIV